MNDQRRDTAPPRHALMNQFEKQIGAVRICHLRPACTLYMSTGRVAERPAAFAKVGGKWCLMN